MNPNHPYLMTVKQEEGRFVATALWWFTDGWHELKANFDTLNEALDWLRGEAK